jgi:tetratricopeptide (TPR) repeat protein
MKDKIPPNVVTYDAPIKKSPDYETAKSWLETMLKEDVQPDVKTYCSLFSKNLSNVSAEDVLEICKAAKCEADDPIQSAIASYRKSHKIEQALRLALDYPRLQAAHKLMRKAPKEALEYFKSIFDSNPQHPNASYALGEYFFETEKKKEAKYYLEKALKLATSEARKAVIIQRLHQIGSETSANSCA